MLRKLRRRYTQFRAEPIARFALAVIAVSPFPEEPEKEDGYFPSLIVAAHPAARAPAISPQHLVLSTLLFVEWALHYLGDPTLLLRLQALVPRLRTSVEQGRLGPAAHARHRATQQERYFHHREAATYDIALHGDTDGLFVAVKRHLTQGRWSGDATLLEAATLAPYEALLQLDAQEGLLLLDWLARALGFWHEKLPVDWPTTADALADPLPPLTGKWD